MEESQAGLSQGTGLEKAHPQLDGHEYSIWLDVCWICKEAVDGLHPRQIVLD
jgi:hypothetical protein